MSAPGSHDRAIWRNFRTGSFVLFGVGGGVRTHDHWNHNPALYQLSYTHREGSIQFIISTPPLFHNSSTRRFTSSDMRISPGQGRVKPSPGHLRVASTPIFEP